LPRCIRAARLFLGTVSRDIEKLGNDDAEKLLPLLGARLGAFSSEVGTGSR
jgi:hypothetical protein